MADGLDVIVVDDDPIVCRMLSSNISSFYTWGKVRTFTDVDAAIDFCLDSEVGLAVFVVDVFLGQKSGFFFLDAVEAKFPSAHEDAIMISGSANDDVVNMCVASDVHYLLEKPIKKYALQLAIRSIVAKYLRFSKRLQEDEAFAKMVSRIDIHRP
jgi:response regulator of citrate/malate metabolism